MKKSMCSLCGRNDMETVVVQKKRRVVRCTHDGLLFVDPMPTPAALTAIYKESYFISKKYRDTTCIGYFAYINERPLLLSYFRYHLEKIRALQPTGKLLEVGCGHGFFLEAARAFPFRVQGIDVSHDALAYAKSHGCAVKEVDLEHSRFTSGSFDILTAFQLIEHVVDPGDFFRHTHRILRPHGLLYLATPRATGYLHRIMGKHWLSFRHQEHLYFFSPETMTKLLKSAGFTDITVKSDVTRFYPMSHLLGGVRYYFRAPWAGDLAGYMLQILKFFHLSECMVPIPLDTMIITARKK